MKLSWLWLSALLAVPAIAQAEKPTVAALFNHQLPRLTGGTLDMAQYRGKALLVVNTASECGFTPQFKQLEALWRQYQGKGLVVLGFPSDDFHQELASDKDVASFCQGNFGVSFPMLSRVHVRGSQAHPLYQQLAALSGTTPKWNFYKYIVPANGGAVQAFSPLTKPDSADFVKALQAALPR